ncbi:MAG: DUF6644 family protein, partial [Candidatus Acidiferrales bacterium]
FSAEATRAALNSLFWLKMFLILLAGVNALIFHTMMYKSVGEWNEDRIAPLGARVYGVLSICIWFGVVGLGRWFSFHLS